MMTKIDRRDFGKSCAMSFLWSLSPFHTLTKSTIPVVRRRKDEMPKMLTSELRHGVKPAHDLPNVVLRFPVFHNGGWGKGVMYYEPEGYTVNVVPPLSGYYGVYLFDGRECVWKDPVVKYWVQAVEDRVILETHVVYTHEDDREHMLKLLSATGV